MPQPHPAVAVLRASLAERAEQIGQDRATAGAQATILRAGEPLLRFAGGHAQLVEASRPMRQDTPMDIASVTKAMVTATLLMQAVDEGLAKLDDPIKRFMPDWQREGDVANAARLLDLLNHSSGLPAWRTFYEELDLLADEPAQIEAHRQQVRQWILQTPREASPGTRHLYSDLGYILLGFLLEQIFAAPLSQLAQERIFTPLELSSARFVDRLRGDPPIDEAASTELCAKRGMVTGVVHDENSYLLGGATGHAGVFCTADDLARFGQHMLAIDHGQASSPIVSPDTLAYCWSEEARPAGGGSHLGGWDTPSGPNSSAGRGFARQHSVGHLGFTGCSLWIERQQQIVAVLLTNRVHPSRENQLHKPLRVAFHEAILAP